MKPLEIYNIVFNLLKTQLNVTVSETYPQIELIIPIKNSMMTVDLKVGSAKKVAIELTSYVEETLGSNECRDLTEKARNLVDNATIENKKTFTSSSIYYDEELCAFCQKSEILCEVNDSSVSVVNVKFGDETLKSSDDTKLNLKRKIAVFYSPISGNVLQDLGINLKSITGTAIVDQTQYDNLVSLFNTATVKNVTIGKTSFNAKLTLFSGRAGGEVKYELLETI